MRISISDPIPKQQSKVDIIRSEFALERLEIEQKFIRLQEITEKSKENTRIHEHKAQRMTKGYTKMKSKNENLYTVNKKLWVHIKDNKIGRFSGTRCRKGEASQKESNCWQ